jgi:hypothetical protein
MRKLLTVLTAVLATVSTVVASSVPAFAATSFAHIDASPFVLVPADFDQYGSIVNTIEASGKVTKPATFGAVLDGPQDFTPEWGICHATGITSGTPTGFCWDAADDGWDNANWRPQGISGSWDAQPNGVWSDTDGTTRKVALASWHGIKASDDFARLTFVDYTDTKNLKFRDVLLVVPVVTDGVANFTNLSAHADGVVWYGNTVLVANGGRMHMFSLKHIWAMTRSTEGVGFGADGSQAPSARWHRFAMPEIGEYYPESVPTGSYIPCAPVTGTRPCLNSLSLDRRGSARDSIVSAEFVQADAAGGRAIRWPMDYQTARPLVSADGKVHADEAFSSPIWHMQGAASDGTNWFMSGTCAGGSGTCIHKAAAGQPPHQQTLVGGGLENLSYQPGSAPRLWGINEGDNRFVFNIPAP